jgi:hypothetical protein
VGQQPDGYAARSAAVLHRIRQAGLVSDDAVRGGFDKIEEHSIIPRQAGRPSHSYHCYMMANLRLVLAAEVAPANQHTSKHSWPACERCWMVLPVTAACRARPTAPAQARFNPTGNCFNYSSLIVFPKVQ